MLSMFAILNEGENYEAVAIEQHIRKQSQSNVSISMRTLKQITWLW